MYNTNSPRSTYEREYWKQFEQLKEEHEKHKNSPECTGSNCKICKSFEELKQVDKPLP